MAAVVTIKQLLESGIHFGHITRKWNPKMKQYIFTSRNGIHIIDLKKTVEKIEKAYQELQKIAATGGKILFLATKKQIKNIIKEEAQDAQQYYVIQRWLGGTFTNFKTITQRINLLHQLYKQEKDGLWKKLPKKEVSKLMQKREKLEKFLGGIKNMKTLPQAIFIVDPQKEIIAVYEAAKLGIKIFGIVDTNCDPDLVDYIIPANDDAIRGVKLITSIIAKAMKETTVEINNNNVDEKNNQVIQK